MEELRAIESHPEKRRMKIELEIVRKRKPRDETPLYIFWARISDRSHVKERMQEMEEKKGSSVAILLFYRDIARKKNLRNTHRSFPIDGDASSGQSYPSKSKSSPALPRSRFSLLELNSLSAESHLLYVNRPSRAILHFSLDLNLNLQFRRSRITRVLARRRRNMYRGRISLLLCCMLYYKAKGWEGIGGSDVVETEVATFHQTSLHLIQPLTLRAQLC
ncbi:hypothetical protein KQX54_021400 [Cotesia glomerata]|uniref:Uncharacterized protein n=1 Tax=Cotesia glomerata TaxID=32391 RepID=A0AAV7J781_COTGL|nr:hypothetical protein KQX54_021400 [Cotesia glomerata]